MVTPKPQLPVSTSTSTVCSKRREGGGGRRKRCVREMRGKRGEESLSLSHCFDCPLIPSFLQYPHPNHYYYCYYYYYYYYYYYCYYSFFLSPDYHHTLLWQRRHGCQV